MYSFFKFWILLLGGIFSCEILLRLVINNRLQKSLKFKDRLSKKLPILTLPNTDPNMSQGALEVLANEYDQHVQLCVAHYGNWSDAIKSKDSRHMPDFDGTFLNVVNGLRTTTDTPSAATQYFYIFGGSTVFCGEVEDKFTICSQVQSLITAENFATSVVNFGRHGSTFSNRLIYLNLCNPQKGDLVLFWFGVNELGWKLLEGKANLHGVPHILRRISEGLKFFSKLLALFEVVSRSFDALVLRPYFQFHAFSETKKSMIQLDEFSKKNGFEYKVILQPNLLTKSVKTPREDAMYNFFMSKDKGKIIKKLLNLNYPKFRGLLGRFNGFDASEIFASADQEVYVDWVHLNSEGNRLAANYIFQIFCGDLESKTKGDLGTCH